MNLTLGIFYIDTIPARIEIDQANVLAVVVNDIRFSDPEVFLDAFPLLDNSSHAAVKAQLLTPLYLGLGFRVDMQQIVPHFTEHVFIWGLIEDRTRLFYKANLILKTRSLSVTLI